MLFNKPLHKELKAMSNTKCPCYECICVAVCRHKEYLDMINQCKTLLDTLYYDHKVTVEDRREFFMDILFDTEKVLKPTSWRIKVDNTGFSSIREGEVSYSL